MKLQEIQLCLEDLNKKLNEASFMDKEVMGYIEEADNNECGPIGDGDEIDECIQGWINKIYESGYERESAEGAIFDSLSVLISENVISDTPDINDSLELKDNWISSFNKHVLFILDKLGISLEG